MSAQPTMSSALHRPSPQAHTTSSSSTASSSSSSSSSSRTSSVSSRQSLDAARPAVTIPHAHSPKPRCASSVEILRCSRCAKCVETVSHHRADGPRRVSVDDVVASGMVRFGTNLYYCERCAKMVGYT